MHKDCYRVVGGNNHGLTFLNNNLPKEKEETDSVDLTKDERIVELEGLLKLEEDKFSMVSKLIFILFITRRFNYLFSNT